MQVREIEGGRYNIYINSDVFDILFHVEGLGTGSSFVRSNS